jgi:hypothetical protein
MGNQKINQEREKLNKINILYHVKGPSLVALKRRGTGLVILIIPEVGLRIAFHFLVVTG